jgi:uncharacterized membrane protein YqaE (UPF0057 family)
MNMKNVPKLALLLVATCIMLSSCSQTSNISRTELNDSSAMYIGQNDNIKTETTKGEPNTYFEKISSSIQTVNEESKETINENNIMVSAQQPILITRIPTDKGIQNNAADNGYHSGIKGLRSNSKESFSEYHDKPNTEQPVNYSNGPGRSSNGIPFFIIFLFAFFIPPVGVALMYGITDKFWICLVLTLLFWLPGMIYAMIQIF